MSKTLGRILTITAAVALNLVPGVGQILSGVLGTALTASLTTAATFAAVGAAGGLAGLGPSAPKPAQSETAIKPPRPGQRLTL